MNLENLSHDELADGAGAYVREIHRRVLANGTLRQRRLADAFHELGERLAESLVGHGFIQPMNGEPKEPPPSGP